jgi:hypothetical protein
MPESERDSLEWAKAVLHDTADIVETFDGDAASKLDHLAEGSQPITQVAQAVDDEAMA